MARRLGTPMLVTKIASVTCSSAMRVCSPSPGVVSTITYRKYARSRSIRRPSDLALHGVPEFGRGRARDDEEPVIMVRERRLQDELVGRSLGDRVDDGALGLETEGGSDVAELEVGVDEHDGVRRDLGEARRQVDRDRGLALSALGRDDGDCLGGFAGFEWREVPLLRSVPLVSADRNQVPMPRLVVLPIEASPRTDRHWHRVP